MTATQADVQYVSDGASNPVGLLVPIALWQQVASERETACLLGNEAVRSQSKRRRAIRSAALASRSR